MQRNVILFFGGQSSERKVSVASAKNVARYLPRARLWFWALDGSVREITAHSLEQHTDEFMREFDPKGKIRFNDLEAALDDLEPGRDVLFLGFHGAGVEDGSLQEKLEKRGLAFTGSDSRASRIAFDKCQAKAVVREHGIRVADELTFTTGSPGADERLRQFVARHSSVVCKPQRDGSSSGLAFIDDVQQLEEFLKANPPGIDFLTEPKLIGREVTVGVVQRADGAHPLPPSEVITVPGGHFDYQGKYLGRGTQEITPAQLSPEQTAMVQQLALGAHRAVGCFGYTRTDIIITKEGPYFLEINTLPGLTKASFIPQQLAAARIEVPDFVAEQLELAMLRCTPPRDGRSPFTTSARR